MQDKVVVVTGASAGIGAEVAKLAAKRGAKTVLVARREKELTDVAKECGPNALVVVADMTIRADVQRVVASAIAKFGHIDAWINNAGQGITRLVSELTDEDVDTMILVNVKSVLYGMQSVLPHFKERQKGHILNVGSMLGRIPFAPIRSAYGASKHAMNSLSSNLRQELRVEYPQIFVSVVHPGVVATEFGSKALHGGPDSRAIPGAQPATEVAAVIVNTLEHPRADVYTRDGSQTLVANYYGAPDMGEAETLFGHPPRAR